MAEADEGFEALKKLRDGGGLRWNNRNIQVGSTTTGTNYIHALAPIGAMTYTTSSLGI